MCGCPLPCVRATERFRAGHTHAGARARGWLPEMSESAERMATLSAMFPDVEQSVLETVLQSVQGDTVAAVEALLSMTDEERAQSISGGPPHSHDSMPIHHSVSREGARTPDAFDAGEAESAARAAQLAEDEELARQLQQQMIFEEEFHEQQVLYQQQQQLSQQGGQPPNGHAYLPNYPGQAQYAAGVGDAGAYHPSVYRPRDWGADGPRDGPSGGNADGSYSSVGDALHAAGSSLYSSASSWWNWATGDDETATRKRREDEGEHESHEMQPIRRARPGGAGSASDATAIRPHDEGRSHLDCEQRLPTASLQRADESEGVVRGELGPSSALSGGGAVRRRVPRQSSDGDRDL